MLQWETAYATAFQIQTSADARDVDDDLLDHHRHRRHPDAERHRHRPLRPHVRHRPGHRSTGYSLWEFQVYGTTRRRRRTGCGTTNAALGQPATASSSTENAGTPAVDAVDGNAGTRWSSAFSRPAVARRSTSARSLPICQVVLQWETAYATAFQIQISTDATNWTSIYSTTTGTGGTQTLNVTGTGRYVRMYGTARATAYGYSLWEFSRLHGRRRDRDRRRRRRRSPAPGSCPWVDSTAPIATRVVQLLAQMTLAQKVSMLHGTGGSSRTSASSRRSRRCASRRSTWRTARPASATA